MTKRLFTDEQEQQICQQYISGLNDYEIADLWGCSQRTIGVIRAKHGVPTRSGAEQYAVSKKKQARLEGNRLFTPEEEQLIAQQYALGINDIDIANHFGCSPCTIGRVRRRLGVTTRSVVEQYATSDRWQASAEAKKLFTPEEEQLICAQYLSGLNEMEIAQQWGCSQVTIGHIRRRHGVEARSVIVGGDNLIDIVKNTGRHYHIRDTEFYAYSMCNYADTVKIGIAYNHEKRAGQSEEQYGDLLLLQVFGTRAEALAIEQAILHATRAAAVCPAELLDWAGASELRTTPLEAIEELLAYYTDQLEELGLKEFIRAYWPMTAAERELLDSWDPEQYNEEVPEEEGYGPS